MTTWVLLLWVSLPYAGGPTAVPGFSSRTNCEQAGKDAEAHLETFLKVVQWTCLEVR